MSSFKSIFALLLLAASQVAQTTAAPTSLPKCTENFAEHDPRGSPMGYFNRDEKSKLDRFIAVSDPLSIVQREESQISPKIITTIDSEVVGITGSEVGIVWQLPNGKEVTRNFFRHANQKCRVAHSAQYASITTVVYI